MRRKGGRKGGGEGGRGKEGGRRKEEREEGEKGREGEGRYYGPTPSQQVLHYQVRRWIGRKTL